MVRSTGATSKGTVRERRGSGRRVVVPRRAGRRRGRAEPSRKTKAGSRRGVRGKGKGGGLGELGRRDGCAAVIRVGEQVGRVRDEVGQRFGARFEVSSAGGTAFVGRHVNVLRRVCRVFAAVGHFQRGKILLKLLEGPATYQALRRVTGLKAGPLYHHVNQLRLCGLAMPKERDLYELTRAGRNVIMAGMALEGLARDGRRRPVSTA